MSKKSLFFRQSARVLASLPVIAAILLASSPANALLPLPELGQRARLAPSLGQALLLFRGTDDYRIGDEWGKKRVSANLAGQPDTFGRAAQATASYGGGTAFYLGKFNNRHLMGTNHHVQPDLRCGGAADFQLIRKRYPCVEVLGHWSDIDFALFEIRVPAADEASFMPLGRNFDFDMPLVAGQPLLTVGHGVAGNPARVLVANQDDDCRVFSEELRFMADPDAYNPGPYKAWSFANGCDVSHGDSGSAMIDRVTGAPIGVIWTGKIPKNPEAQSSQIIQQWLRRQDPKIWTELSYAVPASKIKQHLTTVIDRATEGTQRNRETIAELIQ